MPEVTESTPDRQPWLPDGSVKMVALSLNVIVNDVSIHSVIRAIAASLLLNKPYCSTGLVFQSMNNLAVADLFSMQLDFEEEYAKCLADESIMPSYNLQNLIWLTMVLALAEGLTEISKETVRLGLPQLVALIQYESKIRKGIIKTHGTKHYLSYTIFAEEVKPDFKAQFN